MTIDENTGDDKLHLIRSAIMETYKRLNFGKNVLPLQDFR